MAVGDYFVRRTEVEAASLLEGPEGWLGSDRIDWGPANYRTSFRALWSAEGLHARFVVSDPDPWHTLDGRDDPLWDEEVVEIFLDLDRSGTHYAEVELSPANVLCDVRMIQGSPDKKMDLEWNHAGIRSNVARHEAGWTGALFLPWDGFRSLLSARNIDVPPRPGDAWGFNVYRIERPHGSREPERDAVFSAYSPTGSSSFHVPASFQGLVFA